MANHTVILDMEPDRIIGDIYVWVVRDKKTNLEGIFTIQASDGSIMQAATSSPDLAKQIGDHIRALHFSDKEFSLFRYKKADFIEKI